MKIIQKNLTRIYEFEFREDALGYTIKQWGRESAPFLFVRTSAETEQSIPYDKIPMDNIVKSRQSVRVFGLLAVLCMLGAGISLLFQHLMEGVALLLSMAIFFILRFKVRTGYINYKKPNDKIMLSVMESADGELIQEKIKENRNRKMRELYAFIDPTKSPSDEREKIEWLRKKDVITQEEFESFLKQLAALMPPATPA